MFGDDLLVAPVLEPDFTAWTVYLPGPETWVCCDSNFRDLNGGYRSRPDEQIWFLASNCLKMPILACFATAFIGHNIERWYTYLLWSGPPLG